MDTNNEEMLRHHSQQPIQIASHPLRFGMHNKTGIHGACPIEPLHALHLGLFECAQDEFFEQIGLNSKPNESIQALCKSCSLHFQRQSD